MTSIADAYVELHVDGDHIEGEVRKSVKDAGKSADKDADKAGKDIGASMASGFFKGFGSQLKAGGGGFKARLASIFTFKGHGVAAGKAAEGEFSQAGVGLGVAMSSGFTRGFSIKKGILAAKGSSWGAAVASGFSQGLSGVKDGLGGFKDTISKSFSGMNPRSLGIGALIAGIPLLTSGVSALSGALVAFTGAVVQAGASSLSMVGIIGSLVQAKIVGALAFKDFTKAVAGDEKALAKFSPMAQKTISAVKDLGGEWSKVRTAVQNNVFAGLDKMVARVGRVTLPVLKSGLADTGNVLNDLFKRLGGFVTSEGFVKKFGNALRGNNAILATLSKAAVPLLKGILNVFIALQPAAARLAEKIRSSAVAFAAWSSAPGTVKNIRDLMDRAWKSAGNLWRIFKNLGATLRNVFSAATPAGDGLLKTFADLTGRLAKFTALASTKNAIAEWARKGIEVSGTLFKGLGKGFMMIKGLFDPAILGGFLGIFEKLMPTITRVVKVIQGALKPVLESIGGALAENGPKFAKLFEALGPLLAGVGAVIGELISQSLNLLGTIASVITPVVAAISNFVGPIMTRFAPIIAAIILALGPSGLAGGLVKLVPIIGKFLGPLVRFASVLTKGVAPAVRILGKVVGFVFRGISKVIGVAVRLWWGAVKLYFGLVFKVIAKVSTSAAFIVSRAFSAMKSIVTRVVPAVYGAVKSGFTKALNFIKGIPKKVLSVASAFLNAGTELGGKIIKGIMDGLRAAGGFVQDLGSSIKSAVNNALNLPFTIHGPGPLPDFTIPAFARGTDYAPGGLALVGERGPEIVHVPRGSQVKTAAETRGLLGKTVTQNVSVVQNVQGGPGTPLRELDWAMKYGTGIKRLQEAG